MAAPTVKGSRASGEQVANMTTCCQIAKQLGASAEQMAGALATMMQESDCINMHGGDRDSAGVFQQRPSVGSWGTYAQVTNVPHACKAFLGPYLHYCRSGMDVIRASAETQKPAAAYRNAPGQWLAEGRRDVSIIMGSADFTDASLSTSGSPFTLKTSTRTEPYEFSRGSANQIEDSWTCIGRLAEEVKWARFMRAGELWYVSDNWLARQTPRFIFAEGARGVLSITHSADARQSAAEATVQALAKRWSVLPGDVVRVNGQGPGDGLYLVAGVRRNVTDATSEITLKRPVPAQPEPAASTSSTTVGVGGLKVGRLGASAIGGGAAAGPAQAQALYNACQKMSDMHIPYSQSQRNLVGHPPSADCSSSVSWALLTAGFPLPNGVGPGQWAPVSGAFENWGVAGEGRYFTVNCNAGHVWIRLKGIGPAWRFDTSGGAPGEGPRLRFAPRDAGGFVKRHWQGL